MSDTGMFSNPAFEVILILFTRDVALDVFCLAKLGSRSPGYELILERYKVLGKVATTVCCVLA